MRQFNVRVGSIFRERLKIYKLNLDESEFGLSALLFLLIQAGNSEFGGTEAADFAWRRLLTSQA